MIFEFHIGFRLRARVCYRIHICVYVLVCIYLCRYCAHTLNNMYCIFVIHTCISLHLSFVIQLCIAFVNCWPTSRISNELFDFQSNVEFIFELTDLKVIDKKKNTLSNMENSINLQKEEIKTEYLFFLRWSKKNRSSQQNMSMNCSSLMNQ